MEVWTGPYIIQQGVMAALWLCFIPVLVQCVREFWALTEEDDEREIRHI
jgi:hypothetical protein